jgi:hypothetical protein
MLPQKVKDTEDILKKTLFLGVCTLVQETKML